VVGRGEETVQLEGMGLPMGPPARMWGDVDGKVIGEVDARVVKIVRVRRVGRLKMECMLIEY